MEIIRSYLQTLFNLVFPQEIHISIYNTLDSSEIEKLATQVFVDSSHICIAPFPYKKKLIRNAIFAAKYHSHKRAALLLGQALTPYVAEELAERRMFGTFLEPIIIPVPLHRTRFKERGFNQAERIAAALLQQLGDNAITIQSDFLIRHKNTETQAKRKSKTDRLANLKNAFSVPFPQLVKGKDLILLDDVVTTGTTLSSAQRTLQKAGARNVLCIAVAH